MAERPVDRPGRAAGQRDEALAAEERVERDMRLLAVLRIEPEARRRAASDGGSRPRSGRGARSARAPCAARQGASEAAGASPKSTVACAPMIGCTPALASFSENSSAPNRLLVSVMASAGIASALASLASVSIVSAPSRSEKALCTCRCTKPTALMTDDSMARHCRKRRRGGRVAAGRACGSFPCFPTRPRDRQAPAPWEARASREDEAPTRMRPQPGAARRWADGSWRPGRRPSGWRRAGLPPAAPGPGRPGPSCA